MKRKLATFISLVLVLTLLLSMIPTALAATSSGSTSSTVYMAPGQTEKFTYTIPDTLTSTLDKANLYWTTSNAEYVNGNNGSGDKQNECDVTALKATGSGSVAIRVFKDQATAEQYAKNQYSNSPLYTWNVYVKEWTVKLTASSGLLKSGEKKTLTATVTGPNGHLNGAEVEFSVSDKTKAYFLDSASSTEAKSITKTITTTNTGTTSVTVTADLYGGSRSGEVTVWATVKKSGKGNSTGAAYDISTTSNPSATAEYTQGVIGPEGWGITVPETLTFKVGTYSQKYTPKLTNGLSKPTFIYKYFNPGTAGAAGEWKNTHPDLEIGSDGTVYARAVNPGIKVRVFVEGYENEKTHPYAETLFTITNTTASAVAIDYKEESVKFAMNRGEAVLAYKDTNPTNAVTFDSTAQILPSITLAATVTSAGANDAERVSWSTSDPKVAKFGSETTYVGKNAIVTATGAGTVTITAEIDGEKASMTFTVWQAREYDRIITKPDIPTSVSSSTDAYNDFKEQPVTVHLSRTDGTATLSMKDVDYISTNASKVKVRGLINGFDTVNKIAYFPQNAGKTDPKGLATIESREASLSNIMITSQPENATYKLDAQVGTLSIRANVNNSSNGTYLATFTWYDNNDKGIKTETVPSNKQTYTSTLNLSDYIQSAGSYGFYCVIADNRGNTVKSRTALVTIGGDYNVKITAANTSIKPGDSLSLSAVAQQYNPTKKAYTDVTGNYTLTWTVSDTSVATITGNGKSATLKAKSGGTVTVKATTTIDGKTYEGSQSITITVPTAEDVQLMLQEGENYVMLDGGKLSDAVKAACNTTPSTFSFTQPTGGTIYTSNSLTSSVSASNKYSSSDVSRMAFKPSSKSGSYTITYAAYGTDGQLATGKIVVMTNAGSVSYHISAGESQTMQVSDFRNVYGSGLSYVVFGTASDSRGTLYKGKTASAGKVGSESFYASSGTNLLGNVTFIAGSSTVKYTVTIPFTAYGTSGTAYGNLVIYVNDTHSIYTTGATFKSMAIADEIAPDSGASSAYVTIDSVIGGQLYTQYSSIKSCTALNTRDFGSTKFYLSGSNSIDNLYLLPVADSKSVEVNYTLNGSEKGTIKFKVIQQTSSNKFNDMAGSSKWAANSVDFMYSNGLVNGVTTTSFGPDQNMTRAMLVTILYRAANEPTVTGIANKFTDNKENQYYYNAVLWASSKGIVNGATATTFDPDGKITREQIAAILYRYAGSPTVSTSALSGYSDQSQISTYAVTAMQWAVGTGIITGISNNGRTTLSAKNNATRAQVSVMLHRFLTF